MSDQSNGIPPVEPVPPVAPAQPIAPAQPVAPGYTQPNPYAQPGQQYPGAYPAQQSGQYGPAGYQYAPLPPRRPIVLSLLSMIFGIVGIVGSWIVFIPFVGFFLGLWFPAAAVVLGFIARRRPEQPRGMWIAGLVLGFVGLFFAFASLVFWIIVAANGGFSSGGTSDFGGVGGGIDS